MTAMTTQHADFVLASASPQRTRLLDQMGVTHRVLPVDFHEDHSREDSPEDLVRVLALDKMLARLSIASKGVGSSNVILAADTIVAIGNTRLGKPENRSQAAEFMRMLSGRQHRVLSSLILYLPNEILGSLEAIRGIDNVSSINFENAVANSHVEASVLNIAEISSYSKSGILLSATSKSVIDLISIGNEELESYLDWDEWQGAAGGYRVQGRAGCFVKSITGSFTNIVGLPIELLYAILRRTSFWTGK